MLKKLFGAFIAFGLITSTANAATKSTKLSYKQKRELSVYKKELTVRLKKKEISKEDGRKLIEMRERAYLAGRKPLEEEKANKVFLSEKKERYNHDFEMAELDGKIYSLEKYDLTPRKTPEKCITALKEIALKVKIYSKAVGFKLASKMHIKRSGKNCILYIEVDEDVAYRTAKELYDVYSPLQAYFAKRAHSNSIAYKNSAFICVYYGDKEVVTSNKKNARNIVFPFKK